MNLNSHFLLKPFIKVGLINQTLLDEILKELSISENNNIENSYSLNKKNNQKYIEQNWLKGVKFITNEEIKNLDKRSFGKKIKKITADLYKIDPNILSLESGLLFEPSKCKNKLKFKNDFFLYHLFHVDSCKRYKILISLDESSEEGAQFSYIDYQKIKRNIFYYANIILPGILIRSFSSFLRRISFNLIQINLQPPKLNNYFQDKNKYIQFKNLERGSYIIFNNLHPHSSHTGDYFYKSRMLQLVYK